jgi:SET domain-containing protein
VNNALKEQRNTEFCFVQHPRFGHCRCIRSIKAIAKGEEIFIDYGYDVNEESAPR